MGGSRFSCMKLLCVSYCGRLFVYVYVFVAESFYGDTSDVTALGFHFTALLQPWFQLQ